MSETKWRNVLTAILDRDLQCKVKLLCHGYAEATSPGSPVIIAYDDCGQPLFLEFARIWRPTPGYWEAGAIGPFRSADIEWLALSDEAFELIRAAIPHHLKIVVDAGCAIILGYEFE
jgi:hypothetical protein